MALLTKKSLKKIEKKRNSVHQPVNATYCVFRNKDNTYFQIDTYGSSERSIPGKISQSLQLDKSTAESLIYLLKKEFHLN